MARKYWLMKSEPEEFSIDDLEKKDFEPWDGVRNYQARNMMRDDMKKGDQVFFYHSNCKPPGIAGVMEVVKESYPDPTAFDPDDKHYDPKSKPENPTWYLVDVGFVKKFDDLIPLEELKQHKKLKDFRLIQRGNRLSVMPVTKAEWDFIMGLRK
ncbi:MAG: EVE domain-containing protein [Pseudomonadota bacterium]